MLTFILKKTQHFHEKHLFPKRIKHLKNKNLFIGLLQKICNNFNNLRKNKTEVHEYRLIQVCVRLVKCCYCSSACAR